MRVKGKMNNWVEAGLITQDQFDAINKFEQNKNSGNFGRGMIGLGLFAIVVGILSIIAQNWMHIDGTTKLLGHFILSISAAVSVLHFKGKQQYRLQDAALMIFFGLNLTMIALIGQVFQIEGNLANALILWMIISSPVILYFAKSHITALVWTIAMLVTLGAVAVEYLFDTHRFAFFAYSFALSLFVPLIFLAFGHNTAFGNWRPNFAGMFRGLGSALLLLISTCYIQVWYADWSDELADIVRKSDMNYSSAYMILMMTSIAALGSVALYANVFKSLSKENGLANLTLIFVSIAVISLPVLMPTGGSSMLPTAAFLGYWAFIGWHGSRVDSSRLMSLAIYILALRVFIIYVEAAGGLALTGFGLLLGGVFLIGMVLGARKLSKNMRKDMKGTA